METWYLIIMLMGGYGRAIDHIEFNTEEACIAASHQAIGDWRNMHAVCVRKG